MTQRAKILLPTLALGLLLVAPAAADPAGAWERINREEGVTVYKKVIKGSDLIAVLPTAPECHGLEVPSSVSMEFRQVGRRPFTIINGRERCPVIGFVQPPGG